jgi:hypothetical protein
MSTYRKQVHVVVRACASSRLGGPRRHARPAIAVGTTVCATQPSNVAPTAAAGAVRACSEATARAARGSGRRSIHCGRRRRAGAPKQRAHPSGRGDVLAAVAVLGRS